MTRAGELFAEGKPRTAAPSTAHALRVLFGLGVRELVLSKKTLVVLFLGALLVFTTFAYRAVVAFGWARNPNIPLIFGVVVTEAFLRFMIPVIALFYGASLVTDEVDGRTITYLTTRPIDKPVILWGKFAAFAAVSVMLLEVTLFLCWLSLATAAGLGGLLTHLHLLAKDGAVVVLGILAYGALFTLLGALLRKPVIPGLIFIFVWEMVASLMPGSVQRLTILHWLQALTPHTLSLDNDIPFLASLFQKENAFVAVVLLGLMTAGLLWGAGVAFRESEYRLEK